MRWIAILLLGAVTAYGQGSQTPIYNGLLQSDLDAGGFKILSANMADYAGTGITWNVALNQFEAAGGGGSGTVTSITADFPITITPDPTTTTGTVGLDFDTWLSWDTAYEDRLKWNGGATGLVAATGRTSLGLVIGTDVEAWLGNPSVNGYVLSSTTAGVRSWIAPGGGSTNAFGTIAVSGQTDIVADAAPDLLTLVAGSNITMTTDSATDTLTIAASGGGGGNVSNSGTPIDNRLAIWTDATHIEGDGNLTYDASTLIFSAPVVSATTGFRLNGAAPNGKILIGNATNFIASTAGYPNTAGTSGNVMTSDGTNWTSAPATGGGAPTGVDYLVGTADATLSAEIVVGTSPGGELGGTWASPTIDDSLSVTSWTLITPTIAAIANLTGNGFVKTSGGAGTLSIDTSTYLTTASATSTYQPLDADLTNLAGKTGTNTIYYRSAADTWSAVTIGSSMTFTGGTLESVSGGSGTVTDFSAGDLSPLFTTTEATTTTTPALSFGLTNAAATTVFGRAAGTSGAPTYSSAPQFLKIGNLTTNGFVKTGSSDGTLSVDTSTYLTANQSITLSGDVSGGPAATSITTAIGANKVTLAMMATMATDSILGRKTASTGNVEVLTALPWADTGDVTRAADGAATVLAAGNAGNLNSGTLLAARMPALTGEVTTTVGTVATTIADSVTVTGWTLGSSSITALSNLTSNGFVKTSGGVGTLSIDTSTYLTSTSISDTAYAGTWDTVTTIAPSKNAVYDKIETLQPLDTDLTALAGISGVRGDVIFYGASGWARLGVGTNGNQLTTHAAGADPTWDAPGAGGGSGDVVGPASSVASEIVLFDGVTGKLIKSATGSGLVTATSGVYGTTTNNSTNWDTAFTQTREWDTSLGIDGSGTAAQGRTALGATTVGGNLFTLTNPSAITFLKVNADNTVTAESAATFRTSIGAGTGNGTLTATNIDDTAFAASWNAVTTNAPSKNAIYDYMLLSDTDADGKINVLDLTAGLVETDGSGVVTTATAGTDYVSPAGTETLTNKRISPRVTTITSNATLSPNGDTDDIYAVSALAAAITTISAPTGTPVDGQKLIIRVISDSSVRAISGWNAIYRFSSTLPAPSTTVASTTHTWGFMYNSTAVKWDCLAIAANP